MSTPYDTPHTTPTLVARVGSYLEPQARSLEWSIRLSADGVADRERLTVWLRRAEAQPFAGLGALLRELGAPEAVRRAQRSLASSSSTQGLCFGVCAGADDLRLYARHRDADDAGDRYTALRWSGENVEEARYVCHFLPESPEGVRPQDIVHPTLAGPLAALLERERLLATGAFWLRSCRGLIDRVDLTLAWQPTIAELADELCAISSALGLDPVSIRAHDRAHVRHISFACDGSEPAVTLYLQGELDDAWPASYAAAKEQIERSSARDHRRIEELLAQVSQPQPRILEKGLDTFYDTEDVDAWRRALGPAMHYHHGIFTPECALEDERACDAAFDRAVTELFPFIGRGASVYDVGCGWGGPASLMKGQLCCDVVSLTSSRSQYRLCASRGLTVRLGDAETTIPPGRFDCVLLLESFSHIDDKHRLLALLRRFARRLVMRVNCQDASPASSAFAGTMEMISSQRLRELVEAAGWRIQRWKDRRPEASPSTVVWERRLRSIPGAGDLHLETFRRWAGRVVALSERWAVNNPLIELVAD